MSLFPKEHGAYGQLAFPLVTSFIVAGVSLPALLIGLAAVASFLAHEPLVVLVGRRGARARREESGRAHVWLAVNGATAMATGAAAVWVMPAAVRWSLLLPLAPTILLAAAFLRGRVKTALGESAVALAFSLLAVPVCLSAGSPAYAAWSVALAFASVFVTGTLAVRAVILSSRGGGNPRAAMVTRAIVLVVATAIGAALVTAGWRAVLPWTALVAAAPGLLAALALVALAPSPARLRRIGWTLVSTSAAAALILIAGLAGA